MTAIAITNAHVVPVTGPAFAGTLLVEDGKISALGPGLTAPRDAEVVDAAGAWLLPGLIDAHVHLGIHEEGEGWAGDDVNETTDAVTAAVRALDAINPLDVGFDDAIAAGVTTVNVNPGSANPIGGLTVAIRTHGRVVDDMVLREPSGLKSAMGENPRRVHGDLGRTPSTRLGVALVLRQALTQARIWLDADDKERDRSDLVSAALSRVLSGEIPWRQHAHRTDDIMTAVRIAHEFGYKLVLDHATEAHLIADRLAKENVPVLYGPIMTSRNKIEVRHRTPRAPGILAAAGVDVSIITDHPVVPIDYLIHQVALACKHGMDAQEALRSVTINPARVLGLHERIGSLEVGKDADLVLWSGDPLDTRNRAQQMWQAGREVMHLDQRQLPVISPR